VVLHLAAPGERPAREVVVTLSTAVLEQRQVALRYSSAQSAETERALDPYGLVYLPGRWYVVGYCHLRQAQRVFRVDRVKQVTLLDEPFARPAEFDAVAAVLRALAEQPGTWQVCVLLRTTIEQAQHLLPAGIATVEETSDGVVMRASVTDLVWMARFLIHLGTPFVVREPAALRLTLRQLAAEIVAAAAQEAGDPEPAMRQQSRQRTVP
jgi:predicted DNA-binding transcriptional regulator YafY